MEGIRKKTRVNLIGGLIALALPASISFSLFSHVASANSATTLASLGTPSSVAIDGAGNIYVTKSSGGAPTISIYADGSTDNATFTTTITGGNTGLVDPFGIAVDSNDDIYVADSGAVDVLVYAPESSGNVAPVGEIAGSNTGMISPSGIALDSSGNIYVADSGASSVFVFAAGSNGNVAPTATISGSETGLGGAFGIALDSSNNIYVADLGNAYDDAGMNPAVLVYPAGSNGNVAPIATIIGSDTHLELPYGIAVDSKGNIYVGDDSVLVYGAGSNGNVAPINTISGSNTGLVFPDGVALDASANIYVTDDSDYNAASGASVMVYAAGSNGNSAPMTTLGSPYSGAPQTPVIPIQSGAIAAPTPTPTATPTLAPEPTPTLTATPTPTATPIAGNLSVIPEAVAFVQSVTVKTKSTLKKIAIQNAENRKPVLAASVETGRASALPLSVSSECETAPLGKSCKIPVTFKPNDRAAQTGSMMTSDQMIGSTQLVPLAGTGKAP